MQRVEAPRGRQLEWLKDGSFRPCVDKVFVLKLTTFQRFGGTLDSTRFLDWSHPVNSWDMLPVALPFKVQSVSIAESAMQQRRITLNYGMQKI